MSIIALLIFLFIFLTATIVGIVIFFLYKTSQLEKLHESAELKVITAEAELKVLKVKLQTQSQLDQMDRTAGHFIRQIDRGVIILDQQGHILLMNAYAEHMLEVFSSQILGKQYQDVLQCEAQNGTDLSTMLQTVKSGQSIIFPTWTFMKTSTQNIPISGTISPLSLDANSFAIGIFFRNDTDIYRVSEEQKAFFSAAAHELRSPLTTIRAALALVYDRYDTLEPEKIKDLLKSSKEYANQLLDLVNNFLQIARLDQGRIQIKKESFDMIALTNNVIAKHQLLSRERSLYLHHEFPDFSVVHVWGDTEKVEEILTNLISNAIKYTHQGGITVSHAVEEGRLVTRICDTGTGMSEQQQQLLFRKFQQIGEARNLPSSKSSGLGLYISKTFAQLMGAHLMLEKSEPGQGSTFLFALPVAPNTSNAIAG